MKHAKQGNDADQVDPDQPKRSKAAARPALSNKHAAILMIRLDGELSRARMRLAKGYEDLRNAQDAVGRAQKEVDRLTARIEEIAPLQHA